MAQETVIHRVDAELGAGAELAPIPVDLAHDGIDEFLVAFVEYGAQPRGRRSTPTCSPTADGRAVRHRHPGRGLAGPPDP